MISDYQNNTYSWVGENLKYQKVEPYRTSWIYLSRSLICVTNNPNEKEHKFSNWKDIARWYENICEDKLIVNDVIIKKVAELTEEETTTFDKITKIAEFVQNKIRYVAIEIGEESFIPRKARTTFENKFGDCKDKAILMSSMLKIIGIQSSPILVNTINPIDTTVPSLFHFNHCILGIPADQVGLSDTHLAVENGWLYFDPTDDISPFGQKVYYLHSKNVLVCSSSIEENLQEISTFDPSIQTIKLISSGKIKEDGSYNAECKVIYLGGQISIAKNMIQTYDNEDFEDLLKNNVSDILTNIDFTDINTEICEDSVVITYYISGKGISRNSGAYNVLYPNIFRSRSSRRLIATKRNSPIWFGKLGTYFIDIDWELPLSWTLEDVDKNINSVCEGGSVQLDVEYNGNILSLKRESILFGKALDIQDYLEAQEYEKIRKQIDNYTVFFKSK
ncbi:MAG: transglutaminase-like domain-containing protein [Candidatus Cloacimonetes bacterium]|nr:transglutaminase-like domain-containing protein [Candidatus Cloacimonadota bacterium]